MDKMHKPKIEQKNYVPVEIPMAGYLTNIERAEVVVRDYDGSPLVVAEGIIEDHQGRAGKTFVLSPHMFEQMIEYWTRKMLERAEEADSEEKIVEPDESAWTDDTEQNVRDRARDYASEIWELRDEVDLSDLKTTAWSEYKRSLMFVWREVAENAFEERMRELLGNAQRANQTDNDGNYCDPGKQSGSLYGLAVEGEM